MNPPSAVDNSFTEVGVEHLMVHNIGDFIFRHKRVVEASVDGNRVVCPVKVAESLSTAPSTPAHSCCNELSAEMCIVELFKYLPQIEDLAIGLEKLLSTPRPTGSISMRA